MTIKDYKGLWPSDPRHPKNKTWVAMQARWRHNSFSGSARRMNLFLWAVLSSETTTDVSKTLVRKIQADAEALEISLKTRKLGT